MSSDSDTPDIASILEAAVGADQDAIVIISNKIVELLDLLNDSSTTYSKLETFHISGDFHGIKVWK